REPDPYSARMLKGALAASVTPLRDNGDAVDEDAFGPLGDFYVEAGLDGLLALGTAGEGVLLSRGERAALPGPFPPGARRPPPGRGRPVRRADACGHARARRARRRGRRRRRRRHRAAVFPAGRAVALRA